MADWYDCFIEDPLKDLVRILRNNGFNTFCSCGHRPKPYIQMEWYDDAEVTKIYNLLVENSYNNFIIHATWTHNLNSRRCLEIEFYTIEKEGLATVEEINWRAFEKKS